MHAVFAGIAVLALVSCSSPGNIVSVPKAPEKTADQILFERSALTFAQHKYVETVTLLETLLNTYPESPGAERAKLLLNDCSRIEECDSELKWADANPSGGLQFFPALPEKHHRRKPATPTK